MGSPIAYRGVAVSWLLMLRMGMHIWGILRGALMPGRGVAWSIALRRSQRDWSWWLTWALHIQYQAHVDPQDMTNMAQHHTP